MSTVRRSHLAAMALASFSIFFGVPSSVTFAQQGKFVATGSMATARGVHTATLLNDGKVLIVGGEQDAATVFLASAELYDPTTGTFGPTGNLNSARWGHTATLLTNGKVLIAGGHNLTGDLSAAELYDPATGTFSATGSLNTPRSFHAATRLNNGMVLIAGGCCYLASAELYDPTTGTFSPTGNLNEGREYATATLLNDGKALFAAGIGSNGATGSGLQAFDLASAESYDPTTGTFTTTGSLNSIERYQAATLLSDGTVLITGGIDFPTVAELYNPNTESFAVTGSLVARWLHSATLLSDGTVLVAGGYEAPTILPAPSCMGPTPELSTLPET
jgi:Galactose oxidase, central domain